MGRSSEMAVRVWMNHVEEVPSGIELWDVISLALLSVCSLLPVCERNVTSHIILLPLWGTGSILKLGDIIDPSFCKAFCRVFCHSSEKSNKYSSYHTSVMDSLGETSEKDSCWKPHPCPFKQGPSIRHMSLLNPTVGSDTHLMFITVPSKEKGNALEDLSQVTVSIHL